MVTKRLVVFLALLTGALSGATLVLAIQAKSTVVASIGVLCAAGSVVAVLVAWRDLR